MKKIITILSALALCACAYAKTITELRTEFKAVDSGDWATKCAFFKANAADLGKAWDAYKGNIKPAWDDQAAIFLLAYISGKVDFNGSDWQLCCLHTATFVRGKLASEPTYYADLKTSNWTLDGNKMTQAQISAAAYVAGDFEYFKTAPQEAFVDLHWEADGSTYQWFATNILAMSDVAEAKKVCNTIEGALLLHDIHKAARAQISTLNKALTARLLDAKLLK